MVGHMLILWNRIDGRGRGQEEQEAKEGVDNGF